MANVNQDRRRPYIVVRRTESGTHVQIRGGNNRIVWTTEVYENPRNADRAVDIIFDLVQQIRALGGDEFGIREEQELVSDEGLVSVRKTNKIWKFRKMYE